jgi:NadR type nicotinamide-nucleotide adenylyltransferase
MEAEALSRALVIGKFLPPHAGHHALIRHAESLADAVVVVVCEKAGDVIPARLRAAWLAEAHPRAEIIVTQSDDIRDDDSGAWADRCRALLGGSPDVAVTSEAYGEPFARALGCRHAAFDPDRQLHPVSGSAVLRDPWGHWESLDPAARGFFCLRVCLVGAESTGKSTLSQDLADALQTRWTPEYGREYTEILVRRFGGDMEAVTWTSRDFAVIAREQQRMEDADARAANRVIICDTDSFATAIWHRRYMGKPSPATERIARTTRIRQYLLTDVNTPFEQDGIRDGEAIREWMHEEFKTELARRGRRWAEISGPRDHRLALALDHIRHLQAQPFDYAQAVAGWPAL